jgi:hypothetical protein
MTTSIRTRRIAAAVATALSLSIATFPPSIRAASPSESAADSSAKDAHSTGGRDASGSGSHGMSGMTPQGHQMMMGAHGSPMGAATLALPGQDAFGAIQEIVAKLDADPKTDWSKVDLEGLRQHLIDMNEVTLRADVMAKRIDGGLELVVTGSGRTLTAIQRMVPAHAQEINGINGWSAKTELASNGVLLIVTATDPKEVQRIRGLGFIGILVSGAHHQAHHLAMAKGTLPRAHLD